MEVEYALVTSTALPEKVRQSDNFLEVDEKQWEDLVEYSKKLKANSNDEKVMVLIVAQGTPEQQAEERRRQEEEEKRLKQLEQSAEEAEREKLIQKELKEKEDREKARLRARSREILNALYGR